MSAARLRAWVLAAAAVPILTAAEAAAVTCTVPGSHPSVTAAVADTACTAIEVSGTVAAGLVQIHRPLELRGPAGSEATLDGALIVLGGAGAVSLARLHLQPSATCEGLQVESGAEVTADEVRVSTPLCSSLIFADGFETSDLTVWSAAVP